MVMNITFVVARLTGFERTFSQTRVGLRASGRQSNTVGAIGATVRGGGMWIYPDLCMFDSG